MTLGILLLSMFLFAFNGWACPNLTGTYNCIQDASLFEVMVITQEIRNGVTIYSLNGSKFSSDGEPHGLEGLPALKNSMVKAWCDGAVFKSEIRGEYFQAAEYHRDSAEPIQDQMENGELQLTLELSLEKGSLLQIAAGTLQNAKGEFPIHGFSNCLNAQTAQKIGPKDY
jgi:hypothetical protein